MAHNKEERDAAAERDSAGVDGQYTHTIDALIDEARSVRNALEQLLTILPDDSEASSAARETLNECERFLDDCPDRRSGV